MKIALESFSFCSAETPKSWRGLKAFSSLEPALRGGACIWGAADLYVGRGGAGGQCWAGVQRGRLSFSFFSNGFYFLLLS